MEKLNTNEQPNQASVSTEWDNLGKDVEFSSSRKKFERDIKEQEHVDAAKRREAFDRGIGVGKNSEQAEEIRKNIETLYHMGDAEGAEKQLEKQGSLHDKINSDGNTEMEKGDVENSVATHEKVSDTLARAEFTAKEFAKTNADLAADLSYSKEKVRYDHLKHMYEKWHSPDYKEPKGFFAKRAHKKEVAENIKELRRYGWDQGRKSEEIEMYEASFTIGGKREFGERRASDYSELTELAKGRYGRAVKKALKKKGFDGLPKDLGDQNFTTYEINIMNQIAESVVRSQTYKQKK